MWIKHNCLVDAAAGMRIIIIIIVQESMVINIRNNYTFEVPTSDRSQRGSSTLTLLQYRQSQVSLIRTRANLEFFFNVQAEWCATYRISLVHLGFTLDKVLGYIDVTLPTCYM